MSVVTTGPDLATPAEVRSLLRWSRVVSLDLETTGLSPRRDRVRLLSVGDGNRTLVLDCFEHPLADVLPLLRGKTLLVHNAAFDLAFLWHAGLTDLPETVCTYLVAQLVTAGEGGHGFPPLSLRDCVARWSGKVLPKDLQTSDWSGPLSSDQVEYARRDAAVLVPLFHALSKDVARLHLLKATDVELRALPAFVWMSQSGVPFDRPAWQALAERAAVEMAGVEARLEAEAPRRGKPDLFGHTEPWNWGSSKQVGELLKLIGEPAPSTNDYYLSEVKHPLGALLRKHRELSKRLTTYGHDWLAHVAADGRVYSQWRQVGAASGRTSCGSPNMQQLPRDKVRIGDKKVALYRACVKPPAGRVLVKADYSQIELRLAAKIADEARMKEAYRKGEDLHVLTAALLLGKRPDQVSDDDRQIAKSANFGLVYGMGGPGYRAYAKATYGLDLTEQQALHYRDAFFRAYPGLARWHSDTKRRAGRETRTLTGRRRALPVDAPVTWSLNTPVQGSGADGLKLAMALLWERRAECPGAVPVLAVHDEVVVEAPADRAEEAKDWVVEAMEDGIRDMLAPVPVEVDAKCAPTWGG